MNNKILSIFSPVFSFFVCDFFLFQFFPLLRFQKYPTYLYDSIISEVNAKEGVHGILLRSHVES